MVLSFLDLSYRDTGSIPDFGKNEQKNLQEKVFGEFSMIFKAYGSTTSPISIPILRARRIASLGSALRRSKTSSKSRNCVLPLTVETIEPLSPDISASTAISPMRLARSRS